MDILQADLMPIVTLQPPVRLLPADELAALVREVPLVHRLLRLAEASETGDARLWRAATGSRVVDVLDGVAMAGPAAETLTSGPPDDVLDVWGDVLYALFAPESDPEALDPCSSTLLMLLSHRGPLPVLEIPELTEEAADELARLWLVVREGAFVALTPLGTWAALDLFKTLIGQEIPVHGTTAGVDAPTLLRALRTYDDEERAEEVAVWLGDRDPGQAAKEIAGVLMRVSPMSRAVGLTVLLEDLGQPGRDVVAELRDVPRVGALIMAREAAEDPDHPPTAADVAWVYTDMTVAAMEIGGPPEAVLDLSGNYNVGDVLNLLAMMVHSDHPYTEPMLRFLAEHHPAARVSAAARVALQRWRGVRPPGRGARKPRKPRKPGKTTGTRKRRRH